MSDVPAGRLHGVPAIVTGGAQGIGAAVARRLVTEGALVTVADVDETHGTDLVRDLGEQARFAHLDVADPEAWSRVVAQAEEAHGSLGVLVNNAGIGALTYVESFSQVEYERVMAVNHFGTLTGMRAALPSLRRRGRGSVVNVSSLQGLEADVGLMAYVASKFAVRGVTKVAALEFGKDRIRVNSIHPGLIRTSSYLETIPDDFMGQIPLRRTSREDRAGTPEDVAGLVSFLASDRSSYITGAEITVDGGKSIRFPTRAADHGPTIDYLRRHGAPRG